MPFHRQFPVTFLELVICRILLHIQDIVIIQPHSDPNKSRRSVKYSINRTLFSLQSKPIQIKGKLHHHQIYPRIDSTKPKYNQNAQPVSISKVLHRKKLTSQTETSGREKNPYFFSGWMDKCFERSDQIWDWEKYLDLIEMEGNVEEKAKFKGWETD